MTLSLNHKDQRLDAALQKSAGTNHMGCLQCRACSSGCPFYESMDLGPNRIIRLLQLGAVERALTSNTIWICV
ncbi:MAG: 4Fe-4S dicluster domain-containing protein, partial [Thermodesulfobacteriota bacterium]